MLEQQRIEGDRAFNLGCDARIAGQSRKSNPFNHHHSDYLKDQWRKGWNHADREWGTRAKGAVKPLPAVPRMPREIVI